MRLLLYLMLMKQLIQNQQRDQRGDLVEIVFIVYLCCLPTTIQMPVVFFTENKILMYKNVQKSCLRVHLNHRNISNCTNR